MKKLFITFAAMVALATSAHAVGGIDLSINACPGNPGAMGDLLSIDCASGNGIVILGTWSPAEDISDLVGLDGTMELGVDGDLGTDGFWDFDPAGCNGLALTSSNDVPAGCLTVPYSDVWSPEGSGSGVAAYYP